MNTAAAVIGAGAWGTALSMILAGKGVPVRLWEYDPTYAAVLGTSRENPKFLPGVRLPDAVQVTHALDEAVEGAGAVVLAVPSQKLGSVVGRLHSARPRIWVTASKGIEQSTQRRMTEVLKDEIGPQARVCALSGPSHAEEVSRGLPCTVVAAAAAEDIAEETQVLFMTDAFRVYTSLDVVGVELGGAFKNVIAIAAGVSDGLGLGDNAKAALMTRGLAEMSRLGKALGAEPLTFSGLSGMGDLVVTCTSRHSRNRRVGEELGRGRRLNDILRDMEMVAEGVETTRSIVRLGQRQGVELPIAGQVQRILDGDVAPRDAVRELMVRPAKPEIETTGRSGGRKEGEHIGR